MLAVGAASQRYVSLRSTIEQGVRQAGMLLRFDNLQLEKAWRAQFNRSLLTNDFCFFIGFFLWSLVIYKRWEGGGLVAFIWILMFEATLLFTIALQVGRESFYLKHRIKLLVTLRLIRTLGIITMLGPAQQDIFPSALSSCSAFLFNSLSKAIFYIAMLSVGNQVPISNHIWMVANNTALMAWLGSQRCIKEADLYPEIAGQCFGAWTEKLAFLDKLWIFNFFEGQQYAKMTTPLIKEPWRECIQLQILSIGTLGAICPLLFHVSVEEFSRHKFLASHGEAAFYTHSWRTHFVYNIALTFLAATIINKLAEIV